MNVMARCRRLLVITAVLSVIGLGLVPATATAQETGHGFGDG